MLGMVRSITLGVTLAVLAAAGVAEAQESRIILTEGADYAGHDLKTIKDVDIATCQQACLDDRQCLAFTFNRDAGWCFLKTDFGVLSFADNAVAGRIVTVTPPSPTLEAERRAELDFVPSTFTDEALTLAGQMASRFPAHNATYAALVDATTRAAEADRVEAAYIASGQALGLADEDDSLWLTFAVASSRLQPQDSDAERRATLDAIAGAINAYLRTDDDDIRATSLRTLATGLARLAYFTEAIRALRDSLDLVENADVRADFDLLVADHGFRVTDHEVEADSAAPRICVIFSDPVDVDRADLADFVSVENDPGVAIEAEGSQICIDGVSHGARYRIRLRAGLPAADGQELAATADIDVFVRDRAPWVGFGGNAYVLPAGEGATIPISSVNTDTANAVIYRIGDRALAGAIRSGLFLSQLEQYRADEIAEERGEQIWEGEVAIEPSLNETVVTAIPVGEAIGALQPGVYVMTARAEGTEQEYWQSDATQWFVVSDIGLTALSADDGLHVFARSLSNASAMAGTRLSLVAVNQEVLGESVTDAAGYARFAAGLGRGEGGLRPQLVTARTDAGDYAFLDVARSPFDLNDRGVDGRPAPGPLDVFATTERGIYRPGETVHFTAMVRDPRADAVETLPLTVVAERPDGAEQSRALLQDQGLGGYQHELALIDTAMRGAWRFKLYLDPEDDPLAETEFLVEDFQPERLDFELTTAADAVRVGEVVTVDLAARYLYGAPASGLSAEGEVILSPTSETDAYPGYRFGRADDTARPIREPVAANDATDADGAAALTFALPEPPNSTRLFDAELVLRLTDLGGRAVERRLDLPLQPDGIRLGIRPLFDDDAAPEGGPARFDLIAMAPSGERVAVDTVDWTLDRLETRYQWYGSNGNWNYERTEFASRVDAGMVAIGATDPATLALPVDWGQYRLEIQAGGASTTYEFDAGWYVADTGADTPDILDVALDQPSYRPGDTVAFRIAPRFPGTALIAVMDDRLIETRTVEVGADGATVELTVTEDWGAGAYVTAILHRPMDIDAGRMPARALGLAWATVTPGDRDLDVELNLPERHRPRQLLDVPVAIGNLPAGTEAYIAVAAVDLGILNVTGFEAPAPDDWYFGQRRLGVEIRDFYGQLIDRTQGVPGRIRSGGDGMGIALTAPPPTEELVAFHTGIVRVDANGRAEVSFAIPDFNGTVRVMAMAWSADGVGHAVQDVILADPVVVTASLPQFLHVGDTSRLLVEIDNLDGPAGDYRVALDADIGIGLAAGSGRTLDLASGERTQLAIPIAGEAIGDHQLRLSLTMPDGTVLPKQMLLGVRPAGQPIASRSYVSLDGGSELALTSDALAEYVPGTGHVTFAAGASARLNLPALVADLDRYPYGCAEQITSRALPLVYLGDVVRTLGLAEDAAIPERIDKAIAGVLAKQSASGSFGLWGPGGGDLWLDAYVTDFLTRAGERGYQVPELADRLALDNLANRIAYAGDFSFGGEDLAYAMYVLARNGRALIGDLRYYVETKLADFATPLAKAQLGAALALYGDRARAERAFRAALADLDGPVDSDRNWADYGSTLRDGAAVLTLAVETDQPAVDVGALTARIAAWRDNRRYTSTQEQAWMLLAAAALIEDAAEAALTIDGAPAGDALFRRFSGGDLATPVVVENRGADPIDTVVTLSGIPRVPPPAGGSHFSIERRYYTTDGTPTSVETVAQNDRFVVELIVTADAPLRGQIIVVDPLPAGFQIENPNLGTSGDIDQYGWLSITTPEHTEARSDRFVAAFERRFGDQQQMATAYTVRAVTPGSFVHPAAAVEDMYRPDRQAHTATGSVEVVGPTR